MVAHTLLRTPHGPLTLMTALHDNNPKDLASPDLRMWYQVRLSMPDCMLCSTGAKELSKIRCLIEAGRNASPGQSGSGSLFLV